MIKYEKALDVEKKAKDIILKLSWYHIKLDNVGFLRSYGSNSKRIIARCHALGKAMQIAMNRKGFYLVEIISEKFDKLSEEDKIKVIIHELMHIPKTFGGGFKYHNIVNEKSVNKVYEKYQKIITPNLYGI